MSTVRVEQRDGVLVAVKTAADPDDPDAIARLHHEARFLALARRPGVVQLVGLDDDGGGRLELVTRAVGGGSLATSPPISPERAIAVVAAVASIVAGLHDLGIVHAALDPSHVLLDDEGRPVLCGFGSAGLVGDPLPQRRPAAAGPPPALRPSRDVYALGRLLEHLTADARPPTAAGRRRAHPHASRRSVAGLVAQATATDPTCRPTAAAFADLLHELAPGATLDATDGPRAGTPHRRVVAAAVAASVVVGVVLLEVGRPVPAEVGPPSPSVAAPPVPALAVPSPISTSTDGDATPETGPGATGTVVAPSTGGAADTGAPAPRPIGCDDVRQPVAPSAPAPPCTRSAPAPAEGLVLGADRYAVGDPGDEVLVGDWRCDTSLDVAVVRPRNGDVYLFEHLPHAGDPAEVQAVQLAHLGDGAHLEVGPADPSGCPGLVGRLADGTATGIAVPDHLPSPTSGPEQP